MICMIMLYKTYFISQKSSGTAVLKNMPVVLINDSALHVSYLPVAVDTP